MAFPKTPPVHSPLWPLILRLKSYSECIETIRKTTNHVFRDQYNTRLGNDTVLGYHLENVNTLNARLLNAVDTDEQENWLKALRLPVTKADDAFYDKAMNMLLNDLLAKLNTNIRNGYIPRRCFNALEDPKNTPDQTLQEIQSGIDNAYKFIENNENYLRSSVSLNHFTPSTAPH